MTLKQKQLIKNTANHHIHAHSSSISLCVFYTCRTEEKLVALPVNSSFRWQAIAGIRNSSVANGSIRLN